MQRHCQRRSARVTLGIAAIVALATVGCSSSPSSPASKTTPADQVDPLRRQNTSYLLSIGWEKDQAVCVSRLVKADLEALLTAPDGSDAPTKKPEFAEFADAVRSCLRKDANLSSTTVPAG